MSQEAARREWVIYCVKCNSHFNTERATTEDAERLRDIFDESHPHSVRLKPGGLSE